MPAAILVLTACFFAIPTTSLASFDGLPFDTIPKFAVCFLLLTLIAPSVRRQAFASKRIAAAVAIAATLGIGMKLVLVGRGAYQGFLACYQVGSTPTATCDRSFDNMFGQHGVTQVDETIDFDGTRWRLGAVNSRRFDAQRRDHVTPPVQFGARWTSVAVVPSQSRLSVTYTGSGRIQVDDVASELPASPGSAPRSAEVSLAAGTHRVAVEYRFTPTAADVHGRGAVLTLASADGVRWGVATSIDRALGVAIDASALAVVLLLVFAIGRADPRSLLTALLAIAAAGVFVLVPLSPRVHDKGLELFLIAGCVFWIWRHRPATSIAIVTLAVLCVFRVGWGVGPRPATTEYRLVSDDMLTYESEARDMLQRGSLRAGEDVYYMQILFRYIRFVERALFGESELFIVAAALAALNITYSWLARRVRTIAPQHTLVVLALSVLLLWIVNGLFGAVTAPLSEYPTWILIPVSVGLLFLTESALAWNIAAALMAVGTLDRFNQAPAYAVLIAVFLAGRAAAHAPRWRQAFIAVALGIAIVVAIPLAHNWWYGHQLSVLPDNRSGPNIDLPLWYPFSAAPDAWPALLWKIQQVFDVNVGYTQSFIALHVLQGVLVVTVIAVWRRTLRPSAMHGWLFVAPLAALAVHVFYVVHFYYPRHIVFGHLLGGCVVLVLLAEDGARRTASMTRVLRRVPNP